MTSCSAPHFSFLREPTLFTKLDEDRYALPKDGPYRHLTPERSVQTTVVQAFINTCNNRLALDSSSRFRKSVEVLGLALATFVIGTTIGLGELIIRVAFMAITRFLYLSVMCDWMEGRKCCTNPVVRIPINMGKTTVIALVNIGLSAYAAGSMLFANKNLDIKQLGPTASCGLAPKLIKKFYETPPKTA